MSVAWRQHQPGRNQWRHGHLLAANPAAMAAYGSSYHLGSSRRRKAWLMAAKAI